MGRFRVDLRSDTVTTPTPAMRRAMAEAEVGDEVFREDPTVRALEARAAELSGKEAALFTTSGTLTNQLALKVWTEPGDQVVLDHRSHYLLFEPASIALISQVVVAPVASERGWFGPAEVEAHLTEPAYGTSATSLVAVENSHNRAGGTVWPAALLAELAGFCDEQGIALHMDGARIFNAAAATGRPAAEVAAVADSVSFCLSKGLGAPVGSLLCGPEGFVEEARTLRQVLGGGMRQAGVLAAAGLVALDTMIERLPEDHRRARRLAEGLAEIPGISIDLDRVRTNIVIFDVEGLTGRQLQDALAERGVGCFSVGPAQVRMVLHHQVDDAGVEAALQAVAEVLRR